MELIERFPINLTTKRINNKNRNDMTKQQQQQRKKL